MLDWRPIVYGLVVFLLLLVLTLVYESGLLLLVLGIPCGLVAGYRGGGVLEGLLYGGIVGFASALLLFAGGYSLVTSGPATPGVGMAILVVALLAAVLAVESTLAGGVGGFLSRSLE